jgi:hypothetical protein
MVHEKHKQKCIKFTYKKDSLVRFRLSLTNKKIIMAVDQMTTWKYVSLINLDRWTPYIRDFVYFSILFQVKFIKIWPIL